ncbi:hypothetical protein [Paenibacillus agilis]|uniref:DUF1795 domain-containing protein n=1 Tax=Paenibacillus agilis TaxID=3020863 RepID=A0A559IGR6_9BACL|nr:hypothetical protein [Paenibacillus agilis]TVX86824.1 hypothetical protein FPZ44_23185 [Paenibacillus agilis]
MKKVIALIAMCVFVLIGCAEKEPSAQTSPPPKGSKQLEQRQILDNKVNVLVPTGFEIMSEEMAATKYPGENRPTLIFSDEDASINVAFNHLPTSIKEDELDEFIAATKKQFEQIHPNATWYDDGVTTINNKTVGYLELLTPAVDTNVYNLMFVTELDGRILLGTFNCTEEQMKEWQLSAKEIMHSLQVK